MSDADPRRTPPPFDPTPIPDAERPGAPGLAEAAGLALLRHAAAALRDRRLLVAIVLAAIPALLLAAFSRDRAVSIFVFVEVQLYLPILVPLVAVSLGSGLLHDEAEEGTLTYSLTAPVSRISLALGKWTAALALGWAILGVSLAAAALASDAPFAELRGLVRAAAVAVLLGYPAYLATCALLGTLFRRGFVACLIYAFGYEQILRMIPGAAKRLSLSYYLTSLVHPHAPEKRAFGPLFHGFGPEPERTCVLVLAGATAALLVALVLTVRRREFPTRTAQA